MKLQDLEPRDSSQLLYSLLPWLLLRLQLLTRDTDLQSRGCFGRSIRSHESSRLDERNLLRYH